jgi:hypothetical protein
MTYGAGPFQRILTADLPAAAATVDPAVIVGEITEAGVVSKVEYIPSAAMTNNTTTGRTYTLHNRGSGAGTTKIAELVAATTTGDLVDNVPKIITLQAAANLAVAVGDVLEFISLHLSTGVAEPGGEVRVTVGRS